MRDSWLQTVAWLEKEVSPRAFNTWLKPLTYKNTQDHTVVIEVPNTFYRDRLNQDYAKMIETKLRELSDNQHVVVDFTLPEQTDQKRPGLPVFTSVPKTQPKPAADDITRDVLCARYSFSSFVVGANSEFAHAACQAVSDAPGKTYNPLFIYGGVGLGKTHLLCAVGNEILTTSPSARVLYRSSEQFMNELINSIRYEKTENFRARYRTSCDVLLLDDIQFLGGKERTQEEFFHTFNTLHQANRQIVLTSDRMPKDIPDLDERLRSRFEWGLFCDIQPPDVETRIAILKKKAENSGLDISNDVAHFLAQQIKSNVRVLEGALIRLAAFASLSHREITLDLTKEVFGFLNRDPAGLSIETIQKGVAEFFNLNISDLKSSRRHKVVALPRQIAMYLARKLTSSSFPDIGQRFGGKDHTTVIHAVAKIEKLLSTDTHLRNTLSTLEENLNS